MPECSIPEEMKRRKSLIGRTVYHYNKVNRREEKYTVDRWLENIYGDVVLVLDAECSNSISIIESSMGERQYYFTHEEMEQHIGEML